MLPILKRPFIIFILVCLPFLSHSQAQITDLPTLYITTTNNEVIKSKEAYISGTLKTVNSSSTIGEYDGTIEIRGRGNITWDWSDEGFYPKRPYRIKLLSKKNLLGMKASERSWTLLANHGDKTLMRNALAFKLSNILNFEYTVDYRFVDVVLNGQYIGNYQLADQVEVAANRVPITKIPKADSPNYDITGGYLLEADSYYNAEPDKIKFLTKGGMHMVIKSPDDGDITNQQKEYIQNFFTTVENTLFSINYKDPQNGYQKYFDMPSLINWYLVCEITGNSDAFRSIYMYKKHGQDKIYFGPVWDNDLSWGNDYTNEFKINKRVMDFAHTTDGDTEYKWIQRILTDPNFNRAVAERFEELYSGKLPEELNTAIDELRNLLTSSQAKNFTRWPILQKDAGLSPFYFATWNEHVNQLRKTVTDRLAWLRTSFATSSMSFKDNQNIPSNIVTLTGTIIGSSGSYDGVSTKEKAFDGNNDTYFDSSTGNGQWVGRDLGSIKNISYIKFRPRIGALDRMKGGLFQISDNISFTNPVTIYQIPQTTVENKDYYIGSTNLNGVPAQYVRYLSPDGGYGNIAELIVIAKAETLPFISKETTTGAITALAGTIIGTEGSYENNQAYTKEKAFDGNNETFFNGPIQNGQWVGRDLGSVKNITYIKFRPRNHPDGLIRMKGGRFEISNNSSFINPVTIYEIQQTTLENKDYYIGSTNVNGVAAQFVRYIGPDGSYGNIAELVVIAKAEPLLFGSTETAPTIGFGTLTGTIIGSSGSYDGVSTKEKAFDGNNDTYFDSSTGNGQWVGRDLGSIKNISYIKFRPRIGALDRMKGGLFQISDNISFTNPVTIYQIPQTTVENKDYYIGSTNLNGVPAQYVRYLSPDGGYGNIAELVVIAKAETLPFISKETTTGAITALAGTIIGTEGSYENNQAYTKEKAFDGNNDTYFLGPNPNGQWLGSNLGSVKNITYIKFRPRNHIDGRTRMIGGRFQISDNISFTNPVTIYQIPETTLENKDYYIGSTDPNGVPAQYVRYLSPDAGYGDVAEITIMGQSLPFISKETTIGTTTVLTGTIIGTSGSYQNDQAYTKEKAFDGNNETFFNGPIQNGQWVGRDLGSVKNITYIKFRPRNHPDGLIRMKGGRFEISNNSSFINPVTIYEIQQTTLENKDYYIGSTNVNGVAAQFVRYIGPDGSYGNIAELVVIAKAEPLLFGSTETAPTIGFGTLTGTIIGSSGSYDGVSTKEKAFDGNNDTYFDSSTGNGQWVGRDLGSIKNISYIKFRPRIGALDRMKGGLFQISDNISFTNPVTIYQIPQTTVENKDYYIGSTNLNGVPAQYVRYLSPDGGYGNIAELVVIAKAETLPFESTETAPTIGFGTLTGTIIGSPGSYDGVSTKEKAFDGNNDTYFDSSTGNGQWVGRDLGSIKNISYIKFRPRIGALDRMKGGLFQISDNISFTNPVTIYQIPQTTVENKDYIIQSKNPNGVTAQYVRYLSPDKGFGNVAEITIMQSIDYTFRTSAQCNGATEPYYYNSVVPVAKKGNASILRDNDPASYLETVAADGQYFQWLFEGSEKISCIKFQPRRGYENGMKGGKFIASITSTFDNPITVYTIPTDVQLEAKYYYLTSNDPNGVSFSYLRYVAPDGSFFNVAELQLFKKNEISTSRLSKTTDVNNLSDKIEPAITEVFVYPNPAYSELHLTGIQGPVIEALAFNQDGTSVRLTILNESTLDLSNLTRGFYIIRVNNTYTFKVYKN
jgi:hypothetical protein